MGMLGGLMKGAIAKRAFDEARKPHNQAKIKGLVRSVTSKRGARGGQPPR